MDQHKKRQIKKTSYMYAGLPLVFTVTAITQC